MYRNKGEVENMSQEIIRNGKIHMKITEFLEMKTSLKCDTQGMVSAY